MTTTSHGRSPNWIGSILRIFLRKFPRTYPVRSKTSLERAIEAYGKSGFVDYLNGKGFRVVMSYREVIDFLESKGYIISGLLMMSIMTVKLMKRSDLRTRFPHKE